MIYVETYEKIVENLYHQFVRMNTDLADKSLPPEKIEKVKRLRSLMLSSIPALFKGTDIKVEVRSQPIQNSTDIQIMYKFYWVGRRKYFNENMATFVPFFQKLTEIIYGVGVKIHELKLSGNRRIMIMVETKGASLEQK